MTIIIRLCANLAEIMIFIFFCSQLLKVNKRRSTFVFSIIVIEIVKFLVMEMNHPIYNFISSMILYGCLLTCMFTGKKSLKLFLISMFLCLSVSVEELAFSMMQVLIPDLYDISYVMDHTLLLLFATMLSSIFLFILSNTIITILEAKVENVILVKDVVMLLMLPLSTVMIIISMHFPFGMTVKSNIFLFISELVLLVANITVCNIFKQKLEENKLILENEHLQHNAKVNQIYFEMTQDKVKESKKSRHDYKKHLHLLNGYLQHNEYDQAKKYLEDLLKYHSMNTMLITGNQILDLMIEAYHDKINEYDIDVQLNIQNLNLQKIKSVDLSTIYGNILDNAIESCIRCDEKIIEITFKQVGSYYIMRFINSCSFINHIDGDFTTTKSKEYHGYGLNNIRDAVKKYEGSVDSKYVEDKNLFITTIRFKIDRVT